MAAIEIKGPRNACVFTTCQHRDGTVYRLRIWECGSTTCRYSDNYSAYLPQLNTSGMPKYSDLPYRKVLLSVKVLGETRTTDLGGNMEAERIKSDNQDV